MSETAEPGRKTARIGIFRRVAVEQYMRPLESDTPEMLAPRKSFLALAGVILLCIALTFVFSV